MKVSRIAAALALSLLAACGAQTAPSTDAVGTAVAQTVAAQTSAPATEPTAPAEPAATSVPTTAAGAEAAPTGAVIGALPVDGTAVKGAATAQQPAVYSVELPGASVVTFDMLVGGTGKVFLFRGDEAIFGYDFFGEGQTISERRVLKADEGGPYTLRLDGDVTYELKVAALPQQDGGTAGDAGESLDTAHAISLTDSTSLQGVLGNNDRLDTYRFTLPAGSVAALDVQAGDDDGQLGVAILIDGELYLGTGFYHLNPGEKWQPRWLMNASEGEIVYQLDFHAVTRNPSYTFSLSATPQQDGGVEGDAGDSEAAARPITPGDTLYEGALGDRDTLDFYSFTVPAGTVADLSVVGGEGEGDVGVALLIDGAEQFSTGFNPLKAGGQLQHRLWAGESGDATYVMRLAGKLDYRFTLTSQPQQDGGAEGDAGDSEATARDTAVGQTVTGQVGGQDERDTYRLTLTGPTRLVLNGRIPEGLEGDVRMALWRNGADLGGIGFVVGTPARLSGDEPLPAGEYFLVVTGRGDYQIEVGAE